MSGPSRSDPRRAAWPIASALLIALLVFATFLPALGAELLGFDDLDNLVHNRAWRGLGARELGWMWTASHMGHYQPLTWMSFALDLRLGGSAPGASGELVPQAFHRTSVGLHALTAIAVFCAARRVLELCSDLPARARALGALGAALFFALHPLRVESVAWVTERRDVLSGLFFVLALSAWLRFAPRARPQAPQHRWGAALAAVSCSAGALVAFALALDLDGQTLAPGPLGGAGLGLAAVLLAAGVVAGARAANGERAARPAHYYLACALLALSLCAKAWGLVVPALLLVLDVWPLARMRGPRPGLGARLALLVAEKAPLFALAGVAARLAVWAQGNADQALLTLHEHGPGERLAQALYGLAWYPWKTLAPFELRPIYALPRELSLLDARFALPAAAVLAATAALVALRRRAPAGLAAWVAFAVIVSPVLGLAQSGPQLVADRYSYLAGLPFAGLFGWGLAALAASGRPIGYRGALAVLAPVVLALAAAAHLRARDWHDSLTLWEAAYALAPEDGLTLLSLGAAREEAARSEPDPLRRRALLEGAQELLERGLERGPSPRFLGNLGRVHAQLAELEPGRAGEHRAAALEYARRALDGAVASGAAAGVYRLNLGAALLGAGRAEEALAHLAEYVADHPDELAGRLNLGLALVLAGRPGAALAHLERATALAPDSTEAWGKLGDARRDAGDPAGAAAAYRRVLALEPDHPAARQRLERLER